MNVEYKILQGIGKSERWFIIKLHLTEGIAHLRIKKKNKKSSPKGKSITLFSLGLCTVKTNGSRGLVILLQYWAGPILKLRRNFLF